MQWTVFMKNKEKIQEDKKISNIGKKFQSCNAGQVVQMLTSIKLVQ
jgi:hypothetical protein